MSNRVNGSHFRGVGRRIVIGAGFVFLIANGGCQVREGGEGPGHRPQALALSSEQELELGREASQEVLSNPKEFGSPLPASSPDVKRVRDVAARIIKASEIEPLQREINLHLKDYRFEWDEHVLENRQVNAFCLPGGKIFVFSGLLPIAAN